MKKPVTTTLAVDWPALEEQKKTLVEVAAGQPQDKEDDLMAIVHMIDDIQDAAAKQFGEEIVFPALVAGRTA